ncbi:MAG: HisA/HisF-related TIM barrel protein [Steroidobacteraceae bacterium]
MVKGIRFANHRIVGDIEELARRYCREGADEIVFYDISASPQQRTVDRNWVQRVAEVLDIPFCVAGGIRSVADAEAILQSGAEKISVNTPALAQPVLIDQLARRFGSQCVVVGIDSFAADDTYYVYRDTGDPRQSASTKRLTLEWISEVQDRGAGEIVLNCMNQDGVRQGYDTTQLGQARAQCTVPLVASGGAGCAAHFADVFSVGVDAALAASVFHSGSLPIADLKRFLRNRGVEVRPCN